MKKCELCGYINKNDNDLKYHMVIEHRYEECDECGKTFCDMNHMKTHLEQTKHTTSIHDDILDISLNEERLERLQKDMEAAEAAGGFTY